MLRYETVNWLVARDEPVTKGRIMKAVDNALVRRLDEVRPQGRIEGSQCRKRSSSRETPALPLALEVRKPRKPSQENTQNKLLELAGTWAFFLLAVVCPTVFAGIYFAFFATPQYVSEFRFSVRPNVGAVSSSGGSYDPLLAMSNSYIVSDYVTSRDAVIALDKSVGLRAHYADSSADFFSRLGRDASIEQMVAYWNGRIHTTYDITTGINVIEVSAFTPKAAHDIVLALKALCEKLVNQISDDARRSQMDFALAELERSEKRLKDVRLKEAELRLSQNTVDARKEADGRLQLNLKLRGDLAALQSEYSSLSSYMDAKSPRLSVLKNQISAIKEQMALLQSQVVSTKGPRDEDAPASAIARFDEVQTEIDISSKLYQSALTNYEAARAQANNNQIYLATYVQPSTPENASYPRAFFDTFLVFLSACGIWVVLTLIYHSIRDHV